MLEFILGTSLAVVAASFAAIWVLIVIGLWKALREN